MHGREGENRKRSRHMFSVPTRGTTTATRTVAGGSAASAADFFCKDGRKISVGDCALFKPPQDSPPFIGIIRWLTSKKENNLLLGVNWLYRPAEVKLGEGILLDAAPNEVFYSFHKDEIPAASLLHPCKVAFLPKGVELPSGVSSFICYRVYDIAIKCLWWLTDRDFIDERQEEVDQLVHKTQIEMHATLQPDGRSPKSLNGPTSTSLLKPGPDNGQSAASFPVQAKGRKRERPDQGFEPVKRERSKTDGVDSGQFKLESSLKSEISKITDKGGLVDSEGVEKLVQLMQQERAERRMELMSRSILAGVIAATEKFDCLSQFVQLKGLPVLDLWLQDVHKGKIGDGRDGDKSVEEFLLVLLRALDKLPVNLQSLQMCNIGKSVNNLRSHKNFEIQRKARSLVDTWKKRVEAEMNVIDSKPGSTHAVSWPSRSRLPEVSNGGNRHPGMSSEVAMKSSVTQISASKTASVKPVQGEITAKSNSSSPRPVKSALSPASGKDGQCRIVVGSTSDLPSTTAREERSSSSSQSHNNSQSCSSDHAKTTVFSGKEDARSSTAMSVNKISGSSSRHRRSVNGFPGPTVSGGQKETVSSRSSSLHRKSASEKLSESGLSCEKVLDAPIVEGNSHKLIVKIPNRARSPAQSASGGYVDDRSILNSRASSPVLSEKHAQSDHNSKENSDANRANATSDVNTESWQSNDFKDILTGSEEGDGSPDAIPEEERCRMGEEGAKLAEVSRAASSSSGNELKPGKSLGASFSSMNALIESCAKYSEANASMSAGDDVGMNLLASVAAGEMSKSGLISPTDSPQRTAITVEDSCAGAKLKSSHGNNLTREKGQSPDVADMEQGVNTGTQCRDGCHHLSKQAACDFSGDGNSTSSITDRAPTGEGIELKSSNMDLAPSVELCPEINERSDEFSGAASLGISPASAEKKVLNGEESKEPCEKMMSVPIAIVGSIQDTKPEGNSSLLTNNKVNNVLPSVEDEKAAVEGSSSDENKKYMNEGFGGGDHTEQEQPPVKVQSGHLQISNEELLHRSGSVKDLPSESADEVSRGKADEKWKNDPGMNCARTTDSQVFAGHSAVSDQKSEGLKENDESKDVPECSSGGVVPQKESPLFPARELLQHMISRGSKMTGLEADETEESASIGAEASSSPAAGTSNMDIKLQFDLNEGLVADDGKYSEPSNLVGPGCSASAHLVNAFPFPVSSVCSSLPASVTVAAAAKGPFLPPDDLLRTKGALGWKGSAATSAFRPAEPRKVLDMPPSKSNIPLPDATVSKHARPLLDIDLNVADEIILEDLAFRSSAQEAASTSDHTGNCDLIQNDLRASAPVRSYGGAPVRSFGGFDLDLNQVDETSDMGQYLTSSRRLEASLLPVKSPASGGFPTSEVRRDFDLNDGPVLDDAGSEAPSFSQHVRSSIQSHPPVAGLRISNAEMGTFSSWFTTGNPYPAVPIPSILSDRGEQPFPVVATGGPPRVLGPATGGNPFTPDIYRGSVLSSSPAVPFPSTPFQYPVFPFGANFPMPSAHFSGGSTTYMDSSTGGRVYFPAVNSQLLGPATLSTPQFPRPCVVSLPDGSNNISVENHRNWFRQGLDLNAGPGSLEMEGRGETSPLALRQHSVASSQALAEEQARMYQQAAGGILKRNEPEGGWDAESFRYKHSSWQ